MGARSRSEEDSVSKVTITTCDCCGTEVKHQLHEYHLEIGKGKGVYPLTVITAASHPRKSRLPVVDICTDCINAINHAISKVVREKRTK